MKKLIQLVAIAALAVPVFANGMSQPANASQDQCTPENKLSWYNDFRTNFKTDQAKANEVAKKWLACPAADSEKQQADYLKNFVTLYEKQNRKDQVNDLVYVKKDYAKAFEFGKQVLAEEPDHLKTLIDLAYGGYASKNAAFHADTLTYATKAIQLIEGGKTLENWRPYASRDETLSYLYNAIASVQKDPAESRKLLIKAASFEGNIKKDPMTFATLAGSYNDGPYAKLSLDYEKFKGKDETPESKLALENINQVMDRMIDALARAIALAGTDAKYATQKTGWMETLTGWYKYRNKDSVVGLPEMIAGVLAKPLPAEPQPLTSLPVSAEGTTPAGTAAPTGTPTSTGTPAKPATTPNPATSTSATAPKPAEVAKPKPKRNHGRRS